MITGTTELRIYRVEDDGTLDVYDWTTNDFVATGAGTPDDETTMTHRQRRDSTVADVDTGIWTAVLSTLTNFVAGHVYVMQVTNSNAVPESQEREFQFGGAEGDMDDIDGKTFQQAMRYIAAVVAGKIRNAGSGTETATGLDGTTDRVEFVTDDDGNRSAVEYDP